MGRRAFGILTVAGALVVALAVVTAFALGSTDRSAAAAGAAPRQRTMTTTGTGTATGIPDELSFTVAVSRTAYDVSTALAATSRDMRHVLRALQGLGVRARDMQTTGLAIGPHYTFSGGNERIAGYTVTQRARISVRHIGLGGRAVGVAAKAAGNDVRVSDVRLDIADRGRLLVQARKAAVRDALARAREYASVAGQQVGAMVSLVEVPAAFSPPQDLRLPTAAAAAGGAIAAPVRVGRQDLEVRVRVVWTLA